MIDVAGLTVRFGGVTSLDAVSLRFEAGTCGLIGPNGAGKTTFFNVLSGFVRPASGTVARRISGADLLAMPAFRRARWGVRRTFQTEQAIEELSIYRTWPWCTAPAGWSAGPGGPTCSARSPSPGWTPTRRPRCARWGRSQRRLVELARAVVGAPRLILLDEPAAGLPDAETSHLAGVIRDIPARTGALVILVDHDMSLVSACCASTAVLDFGRLIAVGPTAEVLRDEQVIQAYLGPRRGCHDRRRPRGARAARPDRGPGPPHRGPGRVGGRARQAR